MPLCNIIQYYTIYQSPRCPFYKNLYYSYKIFSHYTYKGLRALMLALVSANILYRIECLLQKPGSVYEKLYHNIHTRAQSSDIGTCYQT